ncbi:MAG TPA: cobalamin-dependent protein [Candidatus Limnocylindrales bacterium]
MREGREGSAPPPLPPVDPAAAGRVPSTTLTPELLASLLVAGDEELATWAIRNSLLEEPRAVVFDGLVRDAMRLVGRNWETGRWDVAEEHLASQTLLRALEAVREPAAPEDRVGPRAVLAGVAGERHGIGLVCLDQVLGDAGWTVADLGVDVPAADLARFVARHGADLVALSAADPARVSAVGDAIAAARAARPETRLPVVLGGRIAESAEAVADLDVDWAGTSLREVDRFARELRARIAAAS